MTTDNPPIEDLAQDARQQIAVDDTELKEARRRRDLVGDALLDEFPGSRLVANGSLAHGDANTPLTDFDLVIVVDDPDDEYGPGKKNADTLKERGRAAIRDALAPEFPNLTVTLQGQKRAALLRFSDPVAPGTTDFTGDVIFALDHPDGGLSIPCWDQWDRSHPESHNRMLRDANAATGSAVAQAVRLIKHWNLKHSKPLCSWHIKVLAVEAITVPMTMSDALRAFFDHAATSVAAGPTPDPADVGPDIKPNLTKTEAATRLRTAADNLADAVQSESDGRPIRARYHLSCVLPDIVEAPSRSDLDAEDANHARKNARRNTGAAIGTSPSIAVPRTRGWADA